MQAKAQCLCDLQEVVCPHADALNNASACRHACSMHPNGLQVDSIIAKLQGPINSRLQQHAPAAPSPWLHFDHQECLWLPQGSDPHDLAIWHPPPARCSKPAAWMRSAWQQPCAAAAAGTPPNRRGRACAGPSGSSWMAPRIMMQQSMQPGGWEASGQLRGLAAGLMGWLAARRQLWGACGRWLMRGGQSWLQRS